MWIEFLPVCIPAVLVGTVAGFFPRRPAAAFLVCFAASYVAQAAGYAVFGPVYFDPRFLGWFFSIPASLGGGLSALVAAMRPRGGGGHPDGGVRPPA